MARRVHVNRLLYGPLKLQLSKQQTDVRIKKNAHVTAATRQTQASIVPQEWERNPIDAWLDKSRQRRSLRIVQIVNNFAVQSYSRKLHIPHIKTSHRTSHFTTRISGHVGIQPENVGLVAADDRTRAKHRFKFRAVGSSTQAFRHSFAVRTVGDWNSLPSHVVEQSTTASFKAELSRMTSAAYAP